jgi:hypothetical protein
LAIQPAIEEGIPFELALSGVDSVNKAKDAIDELKNGNVQNALKLVKNTSGDLPAMYKEVESLFDAGYDFVYDAEKGLYVFTK